MKTFKVGDIVVGNKYNEYGISGRKSVCRVVEIYYDDCIRVEIIEPSGHFINTLNPLDKVHYRGRRYNVQPKHFDLKKPLLTENE